MFNSQKTFRSHANINGIKLDAICHPLFVGLRNKSEGKSCLLILSPDKRVVTVRFLTHVGPHAVIEPMDPIAEYNNRDGWWSIAQHCYSFFANNLPYAEFTSMMVKFIAAMFQFKEEFINIEE